MSSLHRPTPLLEPVGRDISGSAVHAVRQLLAGETLRLRSAYTTGLEVLEGLAEALGAPAETADFPTKQAYRRAYREHASRLIAPVERGRVTLAGAPPIGFLEVLYPELPSFWLPVSEIRQLAQAWSIYDGGVPMPVLGFALHPFYGTYLPKRTEHLELFGTWLSGWKGPRGRAIDVGTGSGVLAFQLARAGFGRVTATDVNPNACESVRREVARRPMPVEVEEGDLLGAGTDRVDLVVFNPPWTQGPVETLLDRALHYEAASLFTRFFDQAAERVGPEGRVVLVFSNVMRLVRPDEPHPIEVELERGRFERVNTMVRRIRAPRSSPRRTRERVEVWELALRA